MRRLTEKLLHLFQIFQAVFNFLKIAVNHQITGKNLLRDGVLIKVEEIASFSARTPANDIEQILNLSSFWNWMIESAFLIFIVCKRQRKKIIFTMQIFLFRAASFSSNMGITASCVYGLRPRLLFLLNGCHFSYKRVKHTEAERHVLASPRVWACMWNNKIPVNLCRSLSFTLAEQTNLKKQMNPENLHVCSAEARANHPRRSERQFMLQPVNR